MWSSARGRRQTSLLYQRRRRHHDRHESHNRGGKTFSFEYLRIQSRIDGIYYVAQPNGRPPTDFKAIELSANRVVFAHPNHDFPKRIIYRKNADGSITARIEGDAGSNEKAQEFQYQALR